ncbi:MAG TPA: gliding motility-associated C-terminal domain-containing protein, partial [Flavisolibacter sp.]
EWFTSTQAGLSTSGVYTVNASRNDTFYVALHSGACNIRDTLSCIVEVSTRPNLVLSKSGDRDCFTRQVQLTATGADSSSWSPSQFISDPSAPNPVVNPESTTWYVVRARKGECVVTDSVQVLVNYSAGAGGPFHIPSAFTPNNDGLNDCFGLQHWPPSSTFELSIYNRWGERIFHTTDSRKCWNGIYKGMLQPIGTYVYQVKTKSTCSDGVVYLKGLVNLIR